MATGTNTGRKLLGSDSADTQFFLMRQPRALGPGCHLFQIALQPGQLVQLLQPQGTGLRGIFGPRPEPVPTPQVALAADQPLPRLQPASMAGRPRRTRAASRWTSGRPKSSIRSPTISVT